MGTRTTNRIVVSGTLFLSLIVGSNVMAQIAAHPSTVGTSPQVQPRGVQNRSAAEHNQACQRIMNECRKLGFIQGQWKKDNGLWKDCFDPVVKGGGSATRDGKPISVPVSPSDVQACRAAEGRR
jgi:hypothetical protein